MKLKNISTFLLCGLTALTTVSCEDFADDFLTQKNPNELSSDIFWDNLDDCNKGLVAVYKSFSSDNLMLTASESNRSDLTFAGTYPTAWYSTDEFYNQTFTDATDKVGQRWAQIYEGIFRANQVIEGLNGIRANMTTEANIKDWERIMGQARFFRGLLHFYASLTYNNGNVPIMDFVPVDEEDFLVPCYAENLVRDFYTKDLEYAESVLPVNGSSDAWSADNSDLGRVTSGAASAVLGTIHLYNKEYDEAKTYFKKIIDNPSYKLVDNIYDNFNGTNELNSESILEIIYSTDFNTEYGLWDGHNLTTSTNYLFGNSAVGAWGSVVPSYWLYRDFSYEPVDRRNPSNKVYLEHDIHGDIYYLNDKNPKITTVGGKTTHSYVVLRKDKIDAGDEDAMTYYVKTVEVDANGEPVIKDISTLDATAKAAMYKQCFEFEAYPARAYKNVPDATQKNFTKDDGVTTVLQQSGECWKVFYDAAGEPYRYKVHSSRASYSVFLPTEVDLPYYQKKQGLEAWSINNALCGYRKFTNWELAKEINASPNGRSAINARIIRLADVYLMYAEACIEGGTNDGGVEEATAYINEVRKRAGTVLIGKEAGAPYAGICTYQDSKDPEATDGESYMNLYNRDGEDDIIDTAAEVMDHLMYKERPLELCLEGFSIRFTDLRRWGVTKKRFTDLYNKPFSVAAFTFYKPEAQAAKSCWTWGFDNVIGVDPIYQYGNAMINYDETKAYFPIPNDEAISNPNIKTVLTSR